MDLVELPGDPDFRLYLMLLAEALLLLLLDDEKGTPRRWVMAATAAWPARCCSTCCAALDERELVVGAEPSRRSPRRGAAPSEAQRQALGHQAPGGAQADQGHDRRAAWSSAACWTSSAYEARPVASTRYPALDPAPRRSCARGCGRARRRLGARRPLTRPCSAARPARPGQAVVARASARPHGARQGGRGPRPGRRRRPGRGPGADHGGGRRRGVAASACDGGRRRGGGGEGVYWFSGWGSVAESVSGGGVVGVVVAGRATERSERGSIFAMWAPACPWRRRPPFARRERLSRDCSGVRSHALTRGEREESCGEGRRETSGGGRRVGGPRLLWDTAVHGEGSDHADTTAVARRGRRFLVMVLLLVRRSEDL